MSKVPPSKPSMRSLLFIVLKISFPPLQRSGDNPVKTRTPERREVIHFYGVDGRMEADPLFVL